MSTWRIEFEMVCASTGQKHCTAGKWTRAFGLMESPEKPSETLACEFIKTNLYYCSTAAEEHFSDTGAHRIVVQEITPAEYVR